MPKLIPKPLHKLEIAGREEIGGLLCEIARVIVSEGPAINEAILTLRAVGSHAKSSNLPDVLVARIAAAIAAIDAAEDAAIRRATAEHDHG